MAKVSQSELAYTDSLPGAERGDPNYFENEVIDHLVSIVLELGAHFWVVRDRLALLEEQLADKGTITLDDLDQAKPSEALQEKLKAEREAMIRQVYGRLYSRSGGDKADASSALMS